MKTIFLFICILFLVGTLGACNTGSTKSVDSLHSSAKAYGKLIRWKAYEDAAKYIRLRDESEINLDIELLNEIRVTKYEVSEIAFNESRDEAVVLADISYYHERVNNVHNIRDQQIWWKDESSGAWYLDGSLPPFVR